MNQRAPRPSRRLLGTLATVLVALLITSLAALSPYLLVRTGRMLHMATGGLTVDPRWPFVAGAFALAGRGAVDMALRAKLDGLLGATGLDPLDPKQPLQRYDIEAITYGLGDWAHGTVQMVYADGSGRRYRIPVVQSSQSWGRPGGWAYTGLDRYYAPHRELPDIPFAAADAPVHLETAQRLPLAEVAQQLGTGVLVDSYTSGERPGEEMEWAPDGKAFLLGARPDPRDRETNTRLWLVHLDGKDPVRVATNTEHFTWSGDGERIAFLRQLPPDPTGRRAPVWEVVATDREGKRATVLARTDVASRPAVIGDTVWYLAADGLWRAGLSGAAPVRVMELPDLRTEGRADIAFAGTPDGQRFAYLCGDRLCLAGPDYQEIVRVELVAPRRAPTPAPAPVGPAPAPVATLPPAVRPPEGPVPHRPSFARFTIAWSPDGSRLATAASDYDYQEAAIPTLWIVDEAGHVLKRVNLGPNGLTREPQWTPDGRWIFLNTFPEAGRRILAVEAASGSIFDLSQPRWDTLFSLGPDGRRLLLWNGRGGFWTVGVSFD